MNIIFTNGVNSRLKCITQQLFFWLAIFFLSSNTLLAANTRDILGDWKTYDLDGNARSIIHFYELNGEYRADVVKVLDKAPMQTLSADYLKQDKHHLHPNTIIYGLKAKANAWVEGEVFDIKAGKQYHCMVSLSDDGQTMHFHAYVFKPLFGRTIDWRRVTG